MWWLAASAGMNFLSAGMQYSAAKQQAAAQQAWQAYSNKMVDLSATQSQNAITTNQLMSADAFAQQAFQIKSDSIFTRARVEASAAAAGVKGNSVNLTVRQTMFNSAQKESQRQDAFQNAMLGFDQQRKQVAMSAAMQKDYSYIPQPNAASYYLGAAMNTFNFGMQNKLF